VKVGAEMFVEDKAIVVTGAGRGLGRSYAMLAAAEGARVVVNDIDADVAEAVVSEIRRSGGVAVASDVDIATWNGAKEVIGSCVSAFGRLDGLVNNAGIFHECKALDETEEGVRSLVEVNILGSMFCGLHALRVMADQGGGSIVNVVSGAALGTEGQSSYGATKGAIVSATYAWASEGRAAGVRVNGLSPIAWTRLAAMVQSARPGLEPQHTAPETIAPLAVYLLSDRSQHVTGQIIRLDETGICILRPAEYLSAVEPRERSAEAIDQSFVEELNEVLQPVGKARLTLSR
jgi:NAD(P)-dependent dehydrogenase (short-subunit alcohol dehydrogenase family)